MRYYRNGLTVRFKARGFLDLGLTPKPRAEGSSPSAPAHRKGHPPFSVDVFFLS